MLFFPSFVKPFLMLWHLKEVLGAKLQCVPWQWESHHGISCHRRAHINGYHILHLTGGNCFMFFRFVFKLNTRYFVLFFWLKRPWGNMPHASSANWDIIPSDPLRLGRSAVNWSTEWEVPQKTQAQSRCLAAFVATVMESVSQQGALVVTIGKHLYK